MLVSALLIVTWACTIMFVFSLFLLYHILFLWASMKVLLALLCYSGIIVYISYVRGFMDLKHVCEVCGRDEVLNTEVAFNEGWDYPPRLGAFGIVSPRTCGRCSINDTVWWALMVDKVSVDDLDSKQKATLERILSEPESILVV